ncbi:hypothetical protein S7711_09021 [Stachybotrys chartarum IBT 7711]|uniref:Glycosyltransferase 2-like domain-containing protein n=1 Tax=Stachybotrys chartarum (strain CBS 109288 / IBT 7711) TaxID=1280523 RepID=A0A084B2N3_STACB|nr:hypothetical protein S7711_09021 [Stachybotrys chartarum IBT 7711]KFA50378.1 hypothetical protein S40293_05242 [Stachybotrys chartarum IBT 40293]KFA72822.1 hypothetical protein S40288_09509 [Stachybotrys chartarum IBT 40288]
MKGRNEHVDEFEIDELHSRQHTPGYGPPPQQQQQQPPGFNFGFVEHSNESHDVLPRDITRPPRLAQHSAGHHSPGLASPMMHWDPSQQTLTNNPYDSRPSSPGASPWAESGRSTPVGMSPGYSKPAWDSRPNSFLTQNTSGAASRTNLLARPPSPVLNSAPLKDGFAITSLHERDDSDIWKGWRRNVFFLVPLMTFLQAGCYLLYLGYRMACVIFAQQAGNEVYIQAWVFIGIEVVVAIPPLLHNMWTMWAIKKRGRPKLRLIGENVPTVDVFVTCCGEDVDVIMDTVRAACYLDYPLDRFRVLLLDDGKDPELEEAMAKLSVMFPNAIYVARPKFPGVPHHFKAGNLNYGLDHVHTLPGGAGQFMAALDADMIPEPVWLRAILPHMLRDQKVALACPPQLFYNVPRGDPLSQSLDFFVHVIEPIKDALGVAWCTGSGYVARRDALDQIGNFPLGSLAEDVATSTHLLGCGWKTAYIHEPLQFGTVPEDYGGHLKQRTRWAIGTVDTSFKLKFCLWGDKVRQMTVAQRFSGFLYASLNLYTILLSVSLFAIPIILIMGRPLVAYATYDQLRWLIRACFATLVSNRLCEFVLSMPAGYHTGRRGARYEMWMSPYIALCVVRSFILPKWLGGQSQAFKPTGSLGSALNERDAKSRKGLFRRLSAILFGYMGWYHLTFVYVTLVGVVLTSFRCIVLQTSLQDQLFALVTHAFWPPLTFVFICSSLWTPIAYAIDPPTVPEREALLDRDPKTGVAHPTPKSKKIAFSGDDAYYEVEYTLTTAFTCLVFVASFIF